MLDFVTVDCEGTVFTYILSTHSIKIMEGGDEEEEEEEEKEEEKEKKKKKKKKKAKVLGEECSKSEYIYYKETDRNFCWDARLFCW